MLTRETAIERLRTKGTLATTPLPKTAITVDDVANPTGRAIARIVHANKASRAARCLAPSANHMVLP